MVTIKRRADSWRKIRLHAISAPICEFSGVKKNYAVTGVRPAGRRCRDARFEAHAGRGSRFQD
jgi:hypothetical protein